MCVFALLIRLDNQEIKIATAQDTRLPCPSLNSAPRRWLCFFDSVQSPLHACKGTVLNNVFMHQRECNLHTAEPTDLNHMLGLFIDSHSVEGCWGWSDNNPPLRWSCNLHLAALQDPLAALASVHTNIHTVITSPFPLPYAHSHSVLLSRKQAWVLGWSENTDLHKTMLCLLILH